MTTRLIHSAALVAALILCCSGESRVACAQSEAELRRTNEQLRTQVRDLERELEAARARIQELEREVEVLRRALAASPGQTPSPGTEPPPIDLSNPTSSPPALLQTLMDEYDAAMVEMKHGVAGSGERAAYLRTVTRWVASVNRQYRKPIEWHVRVEEATAARGGSDMRVVVVDPESSRAIGEPFTVAVPRAIARRYDHLRQRGEDISTLVLRGVLVPDVQVNENRAERGPFNNPPFIGPFAEFGFDLEPRSLLPVGEDNENEQRQ